MAIMVTQKATGNPVSLTTATHSRCPKRPASDERLPKCEEKIEALDKVEKLRSPPVTLHALPSLPIPPSLVGSQDNCRQRPRHPGFGCHRLLPGRPKLLSLTHKARQQLKAIENQPVFQNIMEFMIMNVPGCVIGRAVRKIFAEEVSPLN